MTLTKLPSTLVAITLSLVSASSLHAQSGATGSSQAAAQQKSLIESYRRQDWTGRGTFHRLGMLEKQDQSVALADDANLQNQAAAATEQKASTSISEILSLEVSQRNMFFGSDNIFNTENFKQSGGQYAQFLGVALNAQFDDHWKLTTAFDQAWFFHFKKAQSAADFSTSTVRQALSFDHFILNNKASISIPVGWQYSGLFNRKSGARTLSTWQYGTGVDLSFFPKEWLIPTFSYAYSYQDASGPSNPADKHKHDFNLGLTFIPIKGQRLFLIPSVQYSHEDFSDRRKDDAWTPTMTVSWQPLSWLALDLVGSYTDSRSNAPGSGFKALTATAFIRAFWTW